MSRGILSCMVLKVRDGVPLVWRSPSSLQFGVDAPLAVLDDLDEGTERIVAALVSGISRSGFDMMARSLGLPVDAAERLLATLEPVLARSETAPAIAARVAVTGTGPLADELRRLLADVGALAAPNERAPDLAVIVAGWLVGAEDHGRWLRRDIPHLPVVVGDAGVTVGPFVEPGSGPCLYCIQLAKTDADPAWPAIATQLWGRPAPPLPQLAIVEGAAFAARRIAVRLAAGPGLALSWRVAAADRRISVRAWTRHAECRCATPEGSDWAPVPGPEIRTATRTAAAAAAPA